MAGDNGGPVLAARDLVKEYRQEGVVQRVLEGVTLEVPRGCFFSIMGPSGSGKSTLLHLLGGLDVPDGGEVVLDGEALSKRSDDERTKLRRQEIGIVYQFFNLIPVLTAEENIALPAVIAGRPEKEYKERLDRIVDLVGLGEHRTKQPAQMSGGQQQRAAIGRALFIEPKVLLADEPTGNLDVRTGSEVIQLFLQAQRELGQTIVMVTHDPRISAYSDRVLLLREGRVADELELTQSDHDDRTVEILRWLEKLDAGGAERPAERPARTARAARSPRAAKSSRSPRR